MLSTPYRTTLILLCFALLSVTASLPGDELESVCTFQVRVLGQDRPVPGATVRCVVTRALNQTSTTASVKTDTAGLARWSVPVPTNSYASINVFAEDDISRIGHTSASLEAGQVQADVHLLETTVLEGRLVNEQEQPIAGIQATVYHFDAKDRTQANDRLHYLTLPEWWKERYTATSDAQGRLLWKGIPRHSMMIAKAKVPGYGEGFLVSESDKSFQLKLAPSGAIEVRLRGAQAKELKDLQWSLLPSKPSQEMPRFINRREGKLEGSEVIHLDNVAQGEYTLRINPSLHCAWLPPESTLVQVHANATTQVVVEFKPTATLTGRIIHHGTGEGLPNIPVGIVKVLAGNNVAMLGSVTTDATGRFSALVPPDVKLQTTLFDLPKQYLELPRSEEASRAFPPRYTLSASQKLTIPNIELDRTVKLHGVVVDRVGKSVSGAQVQSAFLSMSSRPYRTQSDAQGKFALDYYPPDPDVESPRVRLGLAVNRPNLIDLDKSVDPLRIELSEDYACRFAGTVTSLSGRPIPPGESECPMDGPWRRQIFQIQH